MRCAALSRPSPLPSLARDAKTPGNIAPQTDESPEKSPILDRRLAYLTTHRSISYSSSRQKRAFEILIPAIPSDYNEVLSANFTQADRAQFVGTSAYNHVADGFQAGVCEYIFTRTSKDNPALSDPCPPKP